MSDYLTVLALALLPAAGNFAGGLLSEAITVSERTLSLALHLAAGIVLAVIGVELMPEALDSSAPWVPIAALVAGGLFFVGIDRTIDLVRCRFGGDEQPGERAAAPWAIFFGVSVDLFSDGVMIGTGSTLSFGLALLLALGQVPADVPEGFATIATFKRAGLARRTRLLLSLAFAVPIFLGATIGYWALRDAPELAKLSILAFTAGVLLSVVIEEMVPEAHRGTDSRWAAMLLVGGFALFSLISVYLG